MGKVISGVLAVLLLLALPGLALADAAGTAKGVAPDADASTKGGTRTLTVGSDIFIGDTVNTGPKGNVQILFADNTRLVVGPQSSLLIEDYLIRNDGSAGRIAVNMLAGSFRFATGTSPKNSYRIDTPTGTIGVRGTEFDVWVEKLGITRILLYHGIVRFCTKSGACKELSDFCQLGQIDTSETAILGDTREFVDDAHEATKTDFIYAENQSSLRREFWFAQIRDCVIKGPGNNAPETIGEATDFSDTGYVPPTSSEPPPDDGPSNFRP